MADIDPTTGTRQSIRDTLRNPELRPDWNLVVVVLVALAVAVVVAAGLGDSSGVIYSALPAVIALAIGLVGGPRVGATLGGITAALMVLAVFASATPLGAAIAFLAVILWLTIPSRLAPSPKIAPLLQLVYFIVAAFGPEGVTVPRALVFAFAGALAGSLLVVAIMAVRNMLGARRKKPTAEAHPAASSSRASTPPASTAPASTAPSAPTPAQLAGFVLGALVSAGLLYWRLSADSQTAAWVLLTFIAVFQPTHPVTTLMSLGRVLGTVIGFALVVVLYAVLPEGLATATGIAALVPAIAYTKRDYVVSVAATTLAVATMYGAPTGEYVGWGLERAIDTAIGAAIAIAVSMIVRRLEQPGVQQAKVAE